MKFYPHSFQSKMIITSTVVIDPLNRSLIEQTAAEVMREATILVDEEGVKAVNRSCTVDACFRMNELVQQFVEQHFEMVIFFLHFLKKRWQNFSYRTFIRNPSKGSGHKVFLGWVRRKLCAKFFGPSRGAMKNLLHIRSK